MSNKTPPSLRAQIIEAISTCEITGFLYGKETLAEALFDKAIMPVLQKAMDAGALLVGRNTKDRVPVNTAIIDWMEQICVHNKLIREKEASISRRQLLKIIYQFGQNCETALAEAKKMEQKVH